MNKLVELEKNEYTNFVKNHKTKSHFLQSYEWGKFAKAKKNVTPYYIGLVNENNKVVAATLLLQKKLPLKYSYFYAPRGFVIDFKDKDLLEEFTKKIVKFIKNKKGIFLKIDPDIIRKEYNYKDEEVNLNYDSEQLFNNIIAAGFKHLGFTKNFETTQPRYTFRIDLTKDLKEIEEHFSKTTMQRINKAKKLGVEVYKGSIADIEVFFKLMALTENRKDFISYSDINYYKTLYEIFKKEDMVDLYLGKVNIKKIIEVDKLDLEEMNRLINNIDKENLSKSNKGKLKEFTRQKETLENNILENTNILKEYGEEIILSAHMIIKYNDKAWVLYAGNHNILNKTYANYLTYYYHLKTCKEEGIKVYDQFGTIGDLNKDNPRYGLHLFKKKFGGDYIEFLGEFDYIANHFMYFVFTKLVPIYRNIKYKHSKEEIKNEINRDK